MGRKGRTLVDDNALREKYIQYRIAGMYPTQAARAAGYKDPHGSVSNLEGNPEIRDIIAAEVANARMESKYTREGVMEVLDEAIGMAKMISDPSAMVRGAQEINKMQGYYAPETKNVVLSGEVTQKLDQISNMSEADLLKRLGKDAAYIDAEFEEIPDAD